MIEYGGFDPGNPGGSRGDRWHVVLLRRVVKMGMGATTADGTGELRMERLAAAVTVRRGDSALAKMALTRIVMSLPPSAAVLDGSELAA